LVYPEATVCPLDVNLPFYRATVFILKARWQGLEYWHHPSARYISSEYWQVRATWNRELRSSSQWFVCGACLELDRLELPRSETGCLSLGRRAESIKRFSANITGPGPKCRRRWFVTSFGILRSTRMPDHIPYHRGPIADKSANRRWSVLATTADAGFAG